VQALPSNGCFSASTVLVCANKPQYIFIQIPHNGNYHNPKTNRTYNTEKYAIINDNGLKLFCSVITYFFARTVSFPSLVFGTLLSQFLFASLPDFPAPYTPHFAYSTANEGAKLVASDGC
jgi:hypothetical protein